MNLKRVLLDLDGVLNDWQMFVLHEMGAPVLPGELEAYKPEWGWDIVRAFNELTGEDLHASQFWDEMPGYVWYEAPKSEIFDKVLLRACNAVGEGNVYIVTSPTLDPYSAAGKMIWVKRHMPRFLRRLFVGPAKHIMAAPDVALIDDRDKNVETFREHGGQACLVPRPWNKDHEKNPSEVIDEFFSR